jgi:small neutral amino acid transporter SnatA (MarC family)
VSESGATAVPLAPLAYAAPEHARPRVALFRVAQFCWAVPLVFGVGILALFALMREQGLAIIGVFTILGGAALFGIGFICLVVFWSLLRNCDANDRRHWSKRSWILFGLMLLNFPIAFGCAWLGVALFKIAD